MKHRIKRDRNGGYFVQWKSSIFWRTATENGQPITFNSYDEANEAALQTRALVQGMDVEI